MSSRLLVMSSSHSVGGVSSIFRKGDYVQAIVSGDKGIVRTHIVISSIVYYYINWESRFGKCDLVRWPHCSLTKLEVTKGPVTRSQA